jgi:hypothetical protein
MASLVLGSSDAKARREYTSDFPSGSSFTMCAWAKATSAIADYRTLLQTSTGDSGSTCTLRFSSSFQFQIVGSVGNSYDNSPSISTNAWYFVAMTCSGTGASDLKAYCWDDTGALTHSVLSITGVTFTPILMMFGNSYTGDYFPGRMARGRAWSVALSQAELEAEMFSESVVKTANFYAGFLDYSTLSVEPAPSKSWSLVGTTSSDSDTPPVLTGCTITDAGDELYRADDSVTITGTNFGAVEGDVYVSPTDNVEDAAKVTQTVTAWADTSITFTAVRSTLATGSTLYLFVVPDTNDPNADGYSVAFEYVPITLTWAM